MIYSTESAQTTPERIRRDKKKRPSASPFNMEPDLTEEPSLLEAAGDGDSKAVSLLLTKDPNLYEQDEEGRTALHIALEAGSTKVVQLLLDAGFDPNKARPSVELDWSGIMVDIVLVAAGAWLVKVIVSRVDSWLRYILPVGLFGKIVSWTLWTLSFGIFGLFVWAIQQVARLAIRGPSLASSATSFKGSTEFMIVLVLDAGFAPDDSEKGILWTHAAQRGYTEVCKRLLSRGCIVDLRFPDPDSDETPLPLITALHCACRASHPNLVLYLLGHGANPTLKDGLGRSTLFFTCRSGSWFNDDTKAGTEAILKALLDTDAIKAINDRAQRPNFFHDDTFPTHDLGWPLAEACCNNHFEAVRLLLEAGADPTVKDDFGFTALHAAARSEIEEDAPICDILLAHYAEVNALTTHGWSPLAHSIMYGRAGGSAASLIRAGAAIGSGAGRFGAPLHMAARHDVSGGKTFRLMLETEPGLVDAIGETHGTPLLAALNRPQGDTEAGQSLDYVKLLVQNQADVNLTPEGHRSPLVEAAKQQSVEVVRFLLENGAELQKHNDETKSDTTDSLPDDEPWRDVFRTSILSWVTPFEGDKYELLLEYGAPSNSDSIIGLGMTNLEYACSIMDVKCIRTASLLLKAGAGPNNSGPAGGFPLHRAAYIRSYELLELLLSNGARIEAHCPAFGTPLNSLCKSLRHAYLPDEKLEEYFSANLILLLSYGSAEDLCRPDGNGMTPLHSLVDLSKQTVVVLDVNKQPPTRSLGDSETVGVVKKFVAELESRDSNIIPHLILARDAKGLLPLHIAARNGDLGLLLFLLLLHQGEKSPSAHEGTDMDGTNDRPGELIMLRDAAGWTLLHHAAANGRAMVCAYILPSDGMSTANIPESDLVAAATLATENDHPRVANYILEFVQNCGTNIVHEEAGTFSTGELVGRDGTPSSTAVEELWQSVPVWYGITSEMALEAVQEVADGHKYRDGFVQDN